jgi:hypothetical protein
VESVLSGDPEARKPFTWMRPMLRPA